MVGPGPWEEGQVQVKLCNDCEQSMSQIVLFLQQGKPGPWHLGDPWQHTWVICDSVIESMHQYSVILGRYLQVPIFQHNKLENTSEQNSVQC